MLQFYWLHIFVKIIILFAIHQKVNAGNSPSSAIKQKVIAGNASSSNNEKNVQTNERLAEILRKEGNLYFDEDNFVSAIRFYSESLEKMISSTTLSNRAQAYLRIENFENALDDAENALKLDPTNCKAKYRKACALLGLNKHEDIAIEELDNCLGQGMDEGIANLKAKVLAKKLERLDVKGKTVAQGTDTDIANLKAKGMAEKLDIKGKTVAQVTDMDIANLKAKGIAEKMDVKGKTIAQVTDMDIANLKAKGIAENLDVKGKTVEHGMDMDTDLKANIHQKLDVNEKGKTVQNEKEAEELRKQGNVNFNNGNFVTAIKFYTESLKEMISSTTLSNRAQAYLRIENFKNALDDAENALKLDPTNCKAKYRKACALLGLNKHEDIAIEELDNCLGQGMDEGIANLKAKVLAKKLERLDVKEKTVNKI